LLAEESECPEERHNLYEQGVKAGRLALGDLFFKKYTGHFWGHLETRPFMRSLAGLSDCLWKNGQRQEAIANYQELLHLNPNDNQGIRYTLVNCLLAEGMDRDAAQLLLEYQESSCFMLYSEALLSFRRFGHDNTDKYLKKALLSNSHVPHFLLGLKPLPWSQPDSYSLGSEEEAIIYATDAYDIWKNTTGALAWLADVIRIAK
jgi:tetratricopeptide (TPR) repeat protein